ncbi:hypothetical protein VPH35_026849 [Triticum aestivum]
MSDDEDPFASLLGKRYHDESLRPPPESRDGEAEGDSWDRREALVDNDTYMIDHRNHTTARCPVTRRGRARRQGGHDAGHLLPRPAAAPVTPPGSALRAEGDLAVIGLVHYWTLQYAPRCIYFVYRARFIGHGLAELRPLPSEVFPEQHESDCHFGHNEVGILCYRSRSGSEQLQLPFTSSNDYDAYKIATLCIYDTNQYVLYTYDSMADAWTRTPAAFPRPQDAPSPPKHLCNKVVTVGGTMGWVDLWDGMILCDVHVPAPSGEEEFPGPRLLRYVPLPEPMQPDNGLPLYGMSSTSSFFRDIAVVNGRIKFVDLQLHASPGSRTPNGWTAVTWSNAPGDSGFTKDGELNSRDMVNPMEPSLFVGHPTLSSCELVSQLITVNMKDKTVERAAKYITQRDASMAFAYTRTTISKFLARASRGNTKRPGSVLHESFRKKLTAINPSEDLPTMGDEGDTIELE